MKEDIKKVNENDFKDDYEDLERAFKELNDLLDIWAKRIEEDELKGGMYYEI